MLKVFSDESGRNDGPLFVMAGFVARSEHWAAFSEEWASILAQSPAVEAFHMKEARQLGQMHKLPSLIRIISSYAMSSFFVAVHRREWDEIIKGNYSEHFDTPYLISFYTIMVLAAEWQIANGLNEKMDFIFDESRYERSLIQSAQDYGLELLPLEARQRIGNPPIHANDKEMPPLQAADILAWAVRRGAHLQDTSQPQEQLLRDILLAKPGTFAYITPEAIVQIAGSIQRGAVLSNSIPIHQWNKLQPNIDLNMHYANCLALARSQPGQATVLQHLPAKGMKRFRLIYKCELFDSPHLHRRSGNVCLGVQSTSRV